MAKLIKCPHPECGREISLAIDRENENSLVVEAVPESKAPAAAAPVKTDDDILDELLGGATDAEDKKG